MKKHSLKTVQLQSRPIKLVYSETLKAYTSVQVTQLIFASS